MTSINIHTYSSNNLPRVSKEFLKERVHITFLVKQGYSFYKGVIDSFYVGTYITFQHKNY